MVTDENCWKSKNVTTIIRSDHFRMDHFHIDRDEVFIHSFIFNACLLLSMDVVMLLASCPQVEGLKGSNT